MKHTQHTREHKGNNVLARLPADYTVVDIETNNVVDGVMEIIEIAALRCRDGHPVASFSTLVHPRGRIDSFVRDLTGITDLMVASAPEPVEALKDFYDFVGQDVLVGHNVNYDINALYDNLERHLGLYLGNDYLDVLQLSKQRLPNMAHHRQVDVAEYFGIDTRGAHRALTDCEICHLNYQCLLRTLSD